MHSPSHERNLNNLKITDLDSASINPDNRNINILALTDARLNTARTLAIRAAQEIKPHTAISQYQESLIIMQELDPEHTDTLEWAKTYDAISQVASTLDDHSFTISNSYLAFKEYKKIQDQEVLQVIRLAIYILREFSNSDITDTYKDVSDTLVNILKSNWDQLNDHLRYEIISSLVDWHYSVSEADAASSLYDFMNEKAKEDISFSLLFKPLNYLLFGRINIIANHTNNAHLLIKSACVILEKTSPICFEHSFALLQLSSIELTKGDFNKALQANYMAVTAIDDKDPRAERLLRESVQGLVNISLTMREQEKYQSAERCIKIALSRTAEHIELMYAQDYRVALLNEMIELLFQQDKLDEAAIQIQRYKKEIKLLDDSSSKEGAIARYFSYKGQLAYLQQNFDEAIEYFKNATNLFYRDEKLVRKSVFYRDLLIRSLIKEGRYDQAMQNLTSLEKLIKSSRNIPMLQLINVKLLQGDVFYLLEQNKKAQKCYLQAANMIFDQPLADPIKITLPTIYQVATFFNKSSGLSNTDLKAALKFLNESLEVVNFFHALDLINLGFKIEAVNFIERIKSKLVNEEQ